MRSFKRSRAEPAPAEPGASPSRRRLTLSADPDRIYAIGDVHGCLAQLLDLEAAIVEDGADFDGLKLIVMLGDYVNRGPDSAGVLDHLAAAPPQGFWRVCLCGNHEDIFRQFLDGRFPFDSWLNIGGGQTLLSYGFDLKGRRFKKPAERRRILDEIRMIVPFPHQTFIRKLPVALTTGSYFFAHAGARPGIALDRQREADLLWIRRSFLLDETPFEKTVVYGHTPTAAPVVRANRIGVDTGAYMGRPLTAARLHGRTVKFLSAPPRIRRGDA